MIAHSLEKDDDLERQKSEKPAEQSLLAPATTF